MYSNTPIRAGSMEIDNLNHMGPEYVIANLMLHSLSPHGRRLVEEFYTGDPFNVDIKLDKESSNRSAEIVNTYLKTMGLRLVFKKILKKKIRPIKTKALVFKDKKKTPAIFFNYDKDFDFVKDALEREKRPKIKAIKFEAIEFLDDEHLK